MNRILLAAVLMLMVSPVAAETPGRPDELSLPALAFDMPVPEEAQLSNGTKVLVFTNHDLPLVNISAYLPMGKRYLPMDRQAACSLLGRVWDEGGFGELTPAEADARLAALGVSLSAGIGPARAYVQVSMVREDLMAGAALWSDLLLRPGLDDERLTRAKARMLKDIRRINDDPGRLAETVFTRLLAGADSPEGHVYTQAEIEAVQRADLKSVYEEFVRPDRAVVGVSGDITPAEAVDLLEPLLGSWRPQARTPALTPCAWQRQPQPGVYLLPGDFEQCHIRLGVGWPELTDLSPDYPEVKLLDFGFGYQRIFYRTRSEGLSYGTSTRLTATVDRGKFWAFGSTRPEKVAALFAAVTEEVARLSVNPLTAEEVETARTFILGTQIQRMETARDIVGLRLQEIVLGQPAGYTAGLIAGLQAATPASIAAVAARYLKFGPAPVVLVVGDPAGGAAALADLGLGPVTVLDTEEFGY